MSESGGQAPDTSEATHPLVLTTLVGGPDLADAEAEVMRQAELYPRANVLANGMATARRELAALGGSWLARVTPSVMRSLHRRVAGGARFPDALRLARADATKTGDPLALATACSFVALGV